MLRLWLAIRWWLFCAVGLLAALAIVTWSHSFKDCVHQHKNDEPYHQLRARSEDLYLRSAKSATRLWLDGFCVADFADKNERPLGALSAIALAIFTFYLWHATRGLRRYAEIQARDMRQLVRLARANALAGIQSARAARNSARAALKQAEIAERSLVDLERPYLFVDSVTGHLQVQQTALAPPAPRNPINGVHVVVGGIDFVILPQYLNAEVTIKNFGRTPAIISEQQFYSIFADTLPPTPTYHEPIARGERVIGPNDPPAKFNPPTYTFTSDEKQRICDGTETKVVFIYGFVRYRDVFGNRYIMGMGARYLRRAKIFTAQGGTAYNYQHKELPRQQVS